MLRPRVLFVVNEVAHYREFKKILENSLSGVIDPLILFDREGYDLSSLFQKEIEDCKLSGFSYELAKTEKTVTTSNFKKKLQKIIYYLHRLHSPQKLNVFFQLVLQTLEIHDFFKLKIQTLVQFYKNKMIHSIVLGEENVLLDTFVYKKAASTQRVFIYPYTIPNPKEMAGGAALVEKRFSLKGFLIYFFGGHFAKVMEEKIYLLHRPSKILALYTLGYFPKNPWALNDDIADKILVESQKMADLYQFLGVPKSRISIIGTFNDDLLLSLIAKKEQLKAEFESRYNLVSKPIILIGFPPNQFPRAEAEKSNYQELIATFITGLKPYITNYTIVITKHPRTQDNLRELTDAGFVVIDEPTLKVIPFSHLYIASVSATIRWAIAAGIPVINYDIYRYNYNDYNTALAVKTVLSEIDFKKELQHILTSTSFYANMVETQLKDSKYWSTMDGKCAARFFEIVSGKMEAF